MVAHNSRGSGGPVPLSLFPSPSSRFSRHDRRAHTHSRAPPRLPAAGGWRGLWPPASFVALLPPFAFCCRRAVGFQAPSSGREIGLGDRPAPDWAGGSLGGSRCPGQSGQARPRRAEAVARAGTLCAARWAKGVIGAAGDTGMQDASRIHRGAETSQRLNLPRKLAK